MVVRHTSLEGQRLAGDKHDACAFIAPVHLEVAVFAGGGTGLPLGAGGEIQARGLVGLATNVAGTDDAVAVRHGKVEDASGVDVLGLDDLLRYAGGQLVDDLNSLQLSLSSLVAKNRPGQACLPSD